MINDIDLTTSNISCGVKEITGVSSTDAFVFKLLVARKASAHGDFSTLDRGYTYVFSDNSSGNGKALAKLIRDNKLGRLISTPWVRNPNSGNKIKTWTWIYNGKVPAAWKKLEVPEILDEGY